MLMFAGKPYSLPSNVVVFPGRIALFDSICRSSRTWKNRNPAIPFSDHRQPPSSGQLRYRLTNGPPSAPQLRVDDETEMFPAAYVGKATSRALCSPVVASMNGRASSGWPLASDVALKVFAFCSVRKPE